MLDTSSVMSATDGTAQSGQSLLWFECQTVSATCRRASPSLLSSFSSLIGLICIGARVPTSL